MNKGLESINTERDIDYGYSDKRVIKTRKCDYCHEKYVVRANDIEYIVKLKGKTYYFCSWSHKSKFRKLHEKELIQEETKNYNPSYYNRKKGK